MSHFAKPHPFWIIVLCVALVMGVLEMLTSAQTNFDATPLWHPAVGRTGVAPDDSCAYPNLSNVLSCGWDAGNQDISDLGELYMNDRVHAYWSSSGRGAYEFENYYSEEVGDVAMAYSAGEYFNDTKSGDACIRSMLGSVRLGCFSSALSGNSSLVVSTNGAVSVTTGPLYLTPQGDLLMGGFTNSPPH